MSLGWPCESRPPKARTTRGKARSFVVVPKNWLSALDGVEVPAASREGCIPAVVPVQTSLQAGNLFGVTEAQKPRSTQVDR